jgi:hypothetical protein
MPTPEIIEYELDGVRTFWVETEPPTTAALMFRVGISDESIRERGITHLVEHLALSAAGHTSLAFNGRVSIRDTIFDVAGDHSEVGAFFTDLTAAISDLPVDRLETEVGILFAEDLRSAGSNFDYLLGVIYGCGGPGGLHYPEFGLRWVGKREVDSWRNSAFTRANAVLAVAGPRRLTSTLSLPSGSALVQQPLTQFVRVDQPTRVATQPAGMCLGAARPRSTALLCGVEVTRERLTQRLRLQIGASYAVSAEYVPLSRTDAYTFLGADCEAGKARMMSTEFVNTIDALLSGGPDVGEISAAVSRLSRWTTAPRDSLARGEVTRRAYAALTGDTWHPADTFSGIFEGLTPDAVREALSDTMNASCAITPEGTKGFVDRVRSTQEPVEGTRFTRVGSGAKWIGKLKKPPTAGGFDELIVGPAGVSIRNERGWVTIPAGEVAYVVSEQPGRVDIQSTDTRWISIGLGGWNRAERLREALAGAIPLHADLPRSRGDARSWRSAPIVEAPLTLPRT